MGWTSTASAWSSSLLARLRGERRFASAAELTEQIGVDIRAATEMFAMRRCSER